MAKFLFLGIWIATWIQVSANQTNPEIGPCLIARNKQAPLGGRTCLTKENETIVLLCNGTICKTKASRITRPRGFHCYEKRPSRPAVPSDMAHAELIFISQAAEFDRLASMTSDKPIITMNSKSETLVRAVSTKVMSKEAAIKKVQDAELEPNSLLFVYDDDKLSGELLEISKTGIKEDPSIFNFPWTECKP